VEMKRIYLDNAATTRVWPEVMQAMLPWFTEDFGNASSVHSYGRRAQRAVDAARDSVAALLGTTAQEIYFTSGGTESDNWALKGFAVKHQDKGKHIISSAIEHHAVIHSLATLKRQGFEVTLLPVDGFGMVKPETLKAAMRPDRSEERV
jgi:cysteine desulfurase